MTLCPKCGAEVWDDAPFCSSCGHVLGEAEAPRPAAISKPIAEVLPEVPEAKEPSKVEAVKSAFAAVQIPEPVAAEPDVPNAAEPAAAPPGPAVIVPPQVAHVESRTSPNPNRAPIGLLLAVVAGVSCIVLSVMYFSGALGSGDKPAITQQTNSSEPKTSEVPPPVGSNSPDTSKDIGSGDRNQSTAPPETEVEPVIEVFYCSKRIDLPAGSACRITYEVKNAEDVTLSNENEYYGSEFRNSDSGYVDVWLPSSNTFTLKATKSGKSVERSVTLEGLSHGDEYEPPAEDAVDILSVAATDIDFADLQSLSDENPLAGVVEAIIKKVSQKEAYGLFRNAICARHGYIFEREDLREFFETKKWYRGDTSDQNVLSSRFSEMEKRNISWLRAREQ